MQLTADQRQFVLDNNLTERHARAVLRLPENRRSEALITIAKRRLNARQTDSYIEQLLNSPPKAGHRISMVRDVRIFVNTIDHAIRLMTDNGVPATAHRKRRTATSSTPCASPPPPRRSECSMWNREEDIAERCSLLTPKENRKCQRFRRAGATKKGLLAPFNPKEVGYTGKN